MAILRFRDLFGMVGSRDPLERVVNVTNSNVLGIKLGQVDWNMDWSPQYWWFSKGIPSTQNALNSGLGITPQCRPLIQV